MTRFFVVLIKIYKTYISPRKGYRCAYAVYFKGDSCSTAVQKIIERRGVLGGYRDIREQFYRCAKACHQINKEEPSEPRKKRRKNKLEDWCQCCDVASCVPFGQCKNSAPKKESCDLPFDTPSCDCSP